MRLILTLALLASPVMAGDLAFVTSQNSNALSVVDLATGDITAQADIPDAPAPVAYDADRGRVYVIAANTGRLHVLDTSGHPLQQAELAQGAFGIATGPDGGLFVANWFGARLMRLDDDLAVVWQSDTGAAPAGVAVSTDGTLVATADRDSDAVSIFSAQDGALLHRVKTAGPHPFGVTFHDGMIWTADVMGDSVSVIDPEAGRLVGQIATGSHPSAVAFAMGRGFVTNQYDGSVTVFDAASRAVLATVTVGDYPEGISTLPDGSAVAIANWDSDTLSILDATDLTITMTVDLPSGPRAFGVFTGPP